MRKVVKIIGAVLEATRRPRPYAESRPIRISELELDPPSAGEVLVRIEAAGVCHSDLSVVDGNRLRPVPMLLGHEAAGRVEALGKGVTDLRIGERVVMTFLPRCEECENCKTNGRLPCSRGSEHNNAGTLLDGGQRIHRDGNDVRHHLGVSGFANYAVVNRASVVPVGDDIPAEIAAVLGCAVLTGGGAVINVGAVQQGDRTVIVGLGGVGMAALMTAISMGRGEVVGIDAVSQKLEYARELGANMTYSPEQAIEANLKAPLVVEAAGNARAFELAVQLTGVGGKTVTVGLPAPDARASIAPLGITSEARTIVGSYLGSAVPKRDIPTYAQLWREGKLPVEKLISSRIGLEQINEAMDQLAEGNAIRQVIMFDPPDRTRASVSS